MPGDDVDALAVESVADAGQVIAWDGCSSICGADRDFGEHPGPTRDRHDANLAGPDCGNLGGEQGADVLGCLGARAVLESGAARERQLVVGEVRQFGLNTSSVAECGLDGRSHWLQQRCALGAHSVTHVALEQLARPDAKAAGAVEHSSTPRALVNQPVGAARVHQGIKRRQGQLHHLRKVHETSEQHNGGSGAACRERSHHVCITDRVGMQPESTAQLTDAHLPANLWPRGHVLAYGSPSTAAIPTDGGAHRDHARPR
jgi:hypothetical protein